MNTSAPVLEEVPCDLCGSMNHDVLRPARDTSRSQQDLVRIFRASSDVPLVDRLVACRHCDLVFVSTRVQAGAMEAVTPDGPAATRFFRVPSAGGPSAEPPVTLFAPVEAGADASSRMLLLVALVTGSLVVAVVIVESSDSRLNVTVAPFSPAPPGSNRM